MGASRFYPECLLRWDRISPSLYFPLLRPTCGWKHAGSNLEWQAVVVVVGGFHTEAVFRRPVSLGHGDCLWERGCHASVRDYGCVRHTLESGSYDCLSVLSCVF